eukprot:355151-Chlamydomonas_euryale.AAC.4
MSENDFDSDSADGMWQFARCMIIWGGTQAYPSCNADFFYYLWSCRWVMSGTAPYGPLAWRRLSYK